MKIYYEKSLWIFRYECRADVKAIIEKLDKIDKLDELEHELDLEYPNGISDTDLHDLFTGDFDYLLSLVNMTEKEFYAEC
jgi:hypothetical protein